MNPAVLPEIRQLENIVGQFMVYWGFKHVHGRIWLHLYLSKQPLDTAELMSRLNVSKALMSNSLRELMDYVVIRPVQTGRHGTVFYEANPDLQQVISGVLRARESVMMDMAKLASQRLAAVDQRELDLAQVSKQRIEAIRDLTSTAQSMLNIFLLMKSSNDSFAFQNLFAESESQS